jgi:molybdopterin adenylyltransferase
MVRNRAAQKPGDKMGCMSAEDWQGYSAPSPKARVLTISDRAWLGTMVDESGPAVCRLLRQAGFEVPEPEVIADERDRIVSLLLSASETSELVVTTGGTGLGPRDVTPQATREVIDYEVPGLAELMRAAGLRQTPLAALSRSLAGVRGRCLIINLPGSVKGATESLGAIIPVLDHACELLRGQTGHGPTTRLP